MMRRILRILVRHFSQVSAFCQNQNLSEQYVELCRGHVSNLRVRSQTPSILGLGTMFPAACQGCQEVRRKQQSPYRLVVRTSRCGRDNPGSTPGGDIWILRGCHTHASLFFLRLDIRFHPLITFADQNSSQGNPASKDHVLMFVSFFVSEERNLQTECMERGSWENTLPAVLCF